MANTANEDKISAKNKGTDTDKEKGQEDNLKLKKGLWREK